MFNFFSALYGLLARLLYPPARQPVYSVLVLVGRPYNRFTKEFSEGIDVAAFTLTDDQEVDVSLELLDKHGNKAKAFSTPSWSVTDPGILDVTPGQDGLTAVVGAVGGVGTAQVSVKVQRSADPNDVLTGVQDFEVVAAAAASLGLVGGTARARSAPVPGPQA